MSQFAGDERKQAQAWRSGTGMLSDFFGSVRRSLRRSPKNQSTPQAGYDSVSRISRFTGRSQNRWWAYDRDVDEDGDDGSEFTADGLENREGDGDGDGDDDADQQSEDAPLLPIFEASRLDALPVYSITHAIRLLVIPKCETTLTWEQIRSPQVSQFLVKPIQKEILENHFSKATVYALIANCLQFNKEAETNPAIVGMSRTRAMVCELLAIRVLKEYSTRELIDVLSYDFYPLQGMLDAADSVQATKRPQAARTSTLEVAIRASAKRFLAHPTVVQQLEAIWAGTIVFHHAADVAHREPRRLSRLQQYGTIQSGTTSGLLMPSDHTASRLNEAAAHLATRRSVTLYDPRQASLFKLSRLRVPRYRHFLSTCSLAVFLGLFLAVLAERSIKISTLELVFWLWSAGFMLDEVVGFNEQGFSLYLLSIWNVFDLGILLLLICFYVLRLYSVLLLGTHKEEVSYVAFDILAANAILLFPRLFSILDHYRYFSQLLIAFRMMAQDLIAVFVLIAISCSGFFVAFTLSFGNATQNAGETAYALFQMLMGFTPTAWELWDNFSGLGRTILVVFLIITHFLVVTILITVLTNSFTAIVQNAHDEHQFVFAVNTISMVKSDALFSYIAPSNILGWFLTPLRYAMPFRQFVWLNRMVIKVTHLPVLFSIFTYERLVLGMGFLDEPDESEFRDRNTGRANPFDPVGSGMMIFSPREPKLREPSTATFFKDRALAEVFRRPVPDTLRQSDKERKKRAAVDTWMQNMGADGHASPPDEEDRDVVDQLERPRYGARRITSKKFTATMSYADKSQGAASDPEDFIVGDVATDRKPINGPVNKRLVVDDQLPEQSDNYGDDELLSNDDATEQMTIGDQDSIADKENMTPKPEMIQRPRLPLRSMTSPNIIPTRNGLQRHSSITFAEATPLRRTPPNRRNSVMKTSTSRRVPQHKRDLSIQTVLFDPSEDDHSTEHTHRANDSQIHAAPADANTEAGSASPLLGKGSNLQRQSRPVKRAEVSTPPRPMLPPRTAMFSTPNMNFGTGRVNATSVLSQSPPGSSVVGDGFRGALHSSYPRKPSMKFDLASDLGDNKATNIGGLPASFTTQMDFANRLRRMRSEERHDDDRRMNKLMLARMGVLEQGFREVLKEVKEMREVDKKKKKIRSAANSLLSSRRDSKVQVNTVTVASDQDMRNGQEPEWVDEQLAGGERGSSI